MQTIISVSLYPHWLYLAKVKHAYNNQLLVVVSILNKYCNENFEHNNNIKQSFELNHYTKHLNLIFKILCNNHL